MMCSIEEPFFFFQCSSLSQFLQCTQCISKGDAKRRGYGELRLLVRDSNGEDYERFCLCVYTQNRSINARK